MQRARRGYPIPANKLTFTSATSNINPNLMLSSPGYEMGFGNNEIFFGMDDERSPSCTLLMTSL